ncbi:MAG TPA: helix-turn-helix domain-containing protein [Hyphomicrobiales bacterium]|nr:helix-turn-helix domain-containing protein [Kaistiaceae bacterium]HQF30191.1 helix-turn-helix domain-containing protein [Hyphomicrobiales bacterium]
MLCERNIQGSNRPERQVLPVTVIIGSPRCRAVERAVADAFRLPVTALRAPTRCLARIALARQVAMYLCHVVLGLTLAEIGDHFGRDRTTVSHACRVVEDRRDEAAFDRLVQELERALEASEADIPA